MIDYLSDYICVLYGRPAVYGVVTLPYSVREGINIFLDGHIPTENLRFRDESLTFRIAEGADDFQASQDRAFSYPKMEKTLGGKLELTELMISVLAVGGEWLLVTFSPFGADNILYHWQSGKKRRVSEVQILVVSGV